MNHMYPLELSLTHAHRDVSSDNQIETDQDFQVKSRSDNIVLPIDMDYGEEQSVLGQTSEEVSDHSVRIERRAASTCKQKMRKWCAQLSQ